MPLTMQAKLLRVLQDREIEAVGSNRLVKIDVRLVTATHQPLEKLVELKHEIVLVVTQPDRTQGRKREVIYSPVKEFALATT